MHTSKIHSQSLSSSLLLLVAIITVATLIRDSYGITTLSTEDNFTIGFYNETNPTISFVSVTEEIISNFTKDDTKIGGFRMFFHGEEGTAPLDTNLLTNGNLTTSSRGWGGSYTFVENGGRDGKGAICLTSEKIAFQTYDFSKIEEDSFGIRVSGWSKADGVSGVEDSDYSMYLEVTYNDGSVVDDISVNVI